MLLARKLIGRWLLVCNQCSKILKLPCTTTFSKILPGGMSIVLPSVATMMTVPVRQKLSKKINWGIIESGRKTYPSV
jgi:hypothetical protein